MDWRVAGDYIQGCTCERQVHWPIDGSMSDANGACNSVSVFRLQEGHYWDTDLAGLTYAVFNFFPARISTGDWAMGLVLEETAHDAQVTAVEAIMHGREGGPMSMLAELIGDSIGTDRGGIGWLEGGDPYAAIEGRGHFTFMSTREDGEPIRAPNAMWVFAEQYEIGRSKGRVTAFGRTFQTDYGEYGKFWFNSNNTGMEREFRPSRLGGMLGSEHRRNPFQG